MLANVLRGFTYCSCLSDDGYYEDMYPSESVENEYLTQNPATRGNPEGGYELDDGANAPEEVDESMKLLEMMTPDIEKPVSLT